MLRRLTWMSGVGSGLCALGIASSCAEAQNVGPDGASGGRGGESHHGGAGGELVVEEGGAGGVLACAADSHVAEKLPLDLYFMMDRSESMGVADPSVPSRWELIREAMTDFVAEPDAEGMGIGMAFFPQLLPNPCYDDAICDDDGDCGPEGAECNPCFVPGFCMPTPPPDSCEPSDYSTPTVTIATLPEAGDTIVQAVTDAELVGATPTSAALDGALDYATAWAAAHRDRIVAVVLATDGDPSSCETDLTKIGDIAREAANGPAHVKTFVVGMGPSTSALDSIAAAGGTERAFLIEEGDTDANALAAALDEVRTGALSCAFALPEPTHGLLDPTRVNVSFTDGEGAEHVVPQVNGATECPSDEPAWYYDDPDDPGRILLCGEACSIVRADSKGTVDVLVGCQTIVR